MQVVVLATPPFWLLIAMVLTICSILPLPSLTGKEGRAFQPESED
jgi:hypothetical protein